MADLSLIKIPHLPLFILEFHYNLQTDNMLLHIILQHVRNRAYKFLGIKMHSLNLELIQVTVPRATCCCLHGSVNIAAIIHYHTKFSEGKCSSKKVHTIQ